MNARVLLLPKRARPFYGRHPWVYPGAIASVEGEPADGDVVDLVSHAGNFIARGFYNGRSKIRVRLYSWDESVALDRDFFRTRLATAVRLRTLLGLDRPSMACRLVFSEADGLSGLIVDRYDRWLAVQFTSFGLAQRKETIVELLAELARPEGMVLRTERGIGQLEGLELRDGPLWGTLPDGPIRIAEADVGFLVNLAEGQKTGFYLDQRDNRQVVARLASGRRVLDAFCYTGGFGLHAARAGAREIIGIDQSEPALELARANARLNGVDNATFVHADVFDQLNELSEKGERFGMVVLDPPKFARDRRAIEEALRGYRRLQTLAIKLLEPEGILVTCCCSGLIAMDMLEELLGHLSAETKREIQILERRGPSPDHPVSASCLESHYLKCLVTRVT